jgi:uncharacterized lipoprotein YbaY
VIGHIAILVTASPPTPTPGKVENDFSHAWLKSNLSGKETAMIVNQFYLLKLTIGVLALAALATPAPSLGNSPADSSLGGDSLTPTDLLQSDPVPPVLVDNTNLTRPLSQVTGTVTYLPRLALPSNAVVEVTLAEVSRADAPAIIVASQTIATEGRQVPIPFQLPYDPEQIEAHLTYVVQARILVDGQLRFISTRRFPVLTQGHGQEIEVMVDPVGGPRP